MPPGLTEAQTTTPKLASPTRGLAATGSVSAKEAETVAWLNDFRSAYEANGGQIPSPEEMASMGAQFAEEHPAWAEAAQAMVADLTASGHNPTLEEAISAFNAMMENDLTLLGTPFADRPEVEQMVLDSEVEREAFNLANPEPIGGEAAVLREFNRIQREAACAKDQHGDRGHQKEDGDDDEDRGKPRLKGSQDRAETSHRRSGRYQLLAGKPVGGFQRNAEYFYQEGVPFPTTRLVFVQGRWKTETLLDHKAFDPLDTGKRTAELPFFNDGFIDNYTTTFDRQANKYVYASLFNNRVPYVRQTTGTECSLAAWTFAYQSLLNSTTPKPDAQVRRDVSNTYSYYKRTYWRANGFLDDVVRSLGAAPSQVFRWMKDDSRPGKPSPMLAGVQQYVKVSQSALQRAIINKQRPMVVIDNGSGWLDGAHWVTLIGYDNQFVLMNESENTQRSKVSYMRWSDFEKARTCANASGRVAALGWTLALIPGINVLGAVLIGFSRDLNQPMILPVNYSVRN